MGNLEEIDKRITEEFKNYNVNYPIFLSSMPLVNKIVLLNTTFKRNQDDENRKKLIEMLGDKNEVFIEKLLGHIKDIHKEVNSMLEEIF